MERVISLKTPTGQFSEQVVAKMRVFINKVKPVSTVSAPGILCGCEPGGREGEVFVRTETRGMGMGSGLGAGGSTRETGSLEPWLIQFQQLTNYTSTIINAARGNKTDLSQILTLFAELGLSYKEISCPQQLEDIHFSV